MVQRVMKEAWADDDELGWAGLGWAGLGPDWLTGLAGSRRGRLQTEPTAHVRCCITVLGPACTALPCPAEPEPADLYRLQTSAAGFPAARPVRPARPNRLQSMGQALGLNGA